MDSDDDIPDTRVFVAGLPPRFTSAQLGAHFSGRYQITDAVVIPGRQIGFVGFRNYTLAKNALKYFDKSYIRMSKISVSMAKPVELADEGQNRSVPVSQRVANGPTMRASVGPTQDEEDDDISQSTAGRPQGPFTPYVPVTQNLSKKRKRDKVPLPGQFEDSTAPQVEPEVLSQRENLDEATAKRKKKAEKEERKKSKQRDLRGAADTDKGGHVDSEAKRRRKEEKRLKKQTSLAEEAEGGAVEGARPVEITEETLSRKKKRSRPDDGRRLEDAQNNKGGVSSSSGDDLTAASDTGADSSQRNLASSDLDWMRTKTSRTLDLVTPEEQELFPRPSYKDQPGSDGIGQDIQSTFNTASDRDSSNVPTSNGRLFIRNLPFSATEVDISKLFSKYGKVDEVHVVMDFKTSNSKGLAYVQYSEPVGASNAQKHLDGKSFQGRLLHVLPAADKKNTKMDEFELAKLPLKKRKAIKRKSEASRTNFGWNSLYMNPDTVLTTVATELGVSKAELLDPTSTDAAVRQALAETDVIERTKKSLQQNGVRLDAFENKARDDEVVLLKNFPIGITSDELRELLTPFGSIVRLVLPTTGTMAVVQYSESQSAQHAIKQLAYRNVRGSVLFLEKGPLGLFNSATEDSIMAKSTMNDDVAEEGGNPTLSEANSSVLFVKNLNFSTTSTRLSEVFQSLAGFLSSRVKVRADPKKPGEMLSMGFGFVEFQAKTHAFAASKVMDGYLLDGHKIQVQISQKTTDLAEERRTEDNSKKAQTKKSKIVIKNLPFEASKKDVRKLFATYGQLKSIRLPKKFDNSTRGFAFAEFVTPKEAENAIKSLRNTHILGRRLVLEYAEEGDTDPEEQIRAIEQKVGQQTSMVRRNKLAGTGRQKFNVGASEQDAI